jgi:hypothetical protein
MSFITLAAHIDSVRVLESVRQIEDAGGRAQALQSIAVTLASAGQGEQALKTLSVALEAAYQIKNAWESTQALRSIERGRTQVLQSIADALASAGQMEHALEAVRQIEHTRERAQALQSIADALTHVESIEQLWPVAYGFHNAISKIDNDDQRSKVYATLAKTLAKWHCYRLAREAAELCSSTEDRLTGYTAVLHSYILKDKTHLA